MISYKDHDVESLYRIINNTGCAYNKQKTIWQLFEEQVMRSPDVTAVICGEDTLTYRQLHVRAIQVANALRSRGIKRNQIVGIMAERSIPMIVGIYGILGAGAAYLPMSPDSPSGRLEYIISDSGLGVVLTQSKFTSLLKDQPITYITLDDPGIFNSPLSAEFDNDSDSTDLMYVIYTSGSTGNPKGVMINHYSVVNRLNWMQKRYPLTDVDTILQKTPFVFDVSVWELFWWAITGAKLYLLEPGMEKYPQAIIEACQTHAITVMHFVPSMLNVFINYVGSADENGKLACLKRVFCSGETLFPTHVNKFYQVIGKQHDIKLTNLYGPTEATVDVTYYDCLMDSELERVPIGKPIDNTQVYILNAGVLQPVGEIGELCLAGEGLARGYLNAPVLNKEKFVDHPLDQGQKMYRTGDYARILANGDIDFIGRIDNQIKIRGLRIELGEIEAKICQHPNVEQCAVLVKNLESVNPVLAAYVLTQDHTVDKRSIKEFIEPFLPVYMIPNRFVLTDHFPVTPNGKLDRKALSLF